jgi:hypothetical protein
MLHHPHLIEEMEMRDAPRLWDADPDVCCAAFQLGACPHTEAFDPFDFAEEFAEAEAEQAAIMGTVIVTAPAAPAIEEPF